MAYHGARDAVPSPAQGAEPLQLRHLAVATDVRSAALATSHFRAVVHGYYGFLGAVEQYATRCSVILDEKWWMIAVAVT